MPRRRSLRGIVEVDFNLIITNDDFLGDGLDNAALLVGREPGPALIEVLGPQKDFFFGKLTDLQSVELGLSRWNFFVELAESIGPRKIFCAESVFVDHFRLIKIVKFFDFAVEFFAFGFEDFQKLGLGINLAIGSFQMQTDFIW
jgi:hypothetical protein